MKFLKDFFKGTLIGAGAILPGISSGVLCVIFGIYDKLIESILGIFKNFKENFFYLLPIAFGGLTGIVFFGNILKHILRFFPMQTKYAFIGLILGSIPVLLKKIHTNKYFRLHYLLYTLIAFIIGFLSICLENYISSNLLLSNFSIQTNCFSASSFFFLIIAGLFMSIGIVVPGVSSTIILMCFGLYSTYLTAISTLNFFILIPLGIGIIFGSIVFLKLINYLLNNFYFQTFYSIIGFTIGSVLVLYEPLNFDITGIISVILLTFSFYIASFFESKQ